MISVCEGYQDLLHPSHQVVFPLFLPNALSVQEGFLTQDEVLPLLCPLGMTFKYQESLQQVLKKRLILGILLVYLCLCQLRSLSSLKLELFLPHIFSKIVLLGAPMLAGCLPDYFLVRFVLSAQFLEHFPVRIAL